MAKILNYKHTIYKFDENTLYNTLPIVINALKSFDPMEIRNSVVIYLGLKAARENGVHAVMIGDGSDELFAGYSFLFNFEKDKLNQELEKLWGTMTFSSIPLAKELRMKAILPFLEPKVKEFACKINAEYKIRSENGKIYGKWILRKAYEEILPPQIVWRDKVPIEAGAGTAILPTFFNQVISDNEFQQKKAFYLNEDKVTIRDKEHLFYYEIFRKVVGIPHPVNKLGKLCPECNSNVADNRTFCRICGAYPI
jgi:asparagine synthase (glutamine-hydrolysing)